MVTMSSLLIKSFHSDGSTYRPLCLYEEILSTPKVTISFLIFTFILANGAVFEKASLTFISHLKTSLVSSFINLSKFFSNPERVPLTPSFANITKPLILLSSHSFFINFNF